MADGATAMNELDAIAVTGMGAICALGSDCAALWRAVEQGRDGIDIVRRFSTDELSTHLGALVPGHLEPVDGDEGAVAYALCGQLARAAGREALAAASVVPERMDGARIGLVLGASILDSARSVHGLADELGEALGLHGPRVTISTACASSTNAVGLGRDLLDAGDCDLVLAGGADALTRTLFAGFHALGVLSADKCAPFSTSTGTTLGEGAGFVVLERLRDARRRGAVPHAILLGYGLSGDAYHETSPDPTGAGVARALRGALQHAHVEPHEIGYANVHGTGTEANDPAEARAYVDVFGEALDRLPMSASKSFLGHAQAAAGILELIVTLQALERQVVPPTLHFTAPRRGAPSDVVAQRLPRPHRFDAAIKTSAAFGGANAAVVVARPEAAASARTRASFVRDVWLRGVGATADGANGDDHEVAKLLRCVDQRALDLSSRLLTAASALALHDGGAAITSATRGRAGLIVGATRLSPESAARFERSKRERGLANLSVAAFARLVLHATAGSCATALSLRGPLSTITTGPGSGLAALAYAAQLLSTRADADVIVAGAVDERAVEEADADRAQGAAAVLLGVEPPTDGPRIRVGGWAFGAANASHATALSALVRAGLDAAQVPTWIAPEGPPLDAAGELLACVRAVGSLRRGEAEHALVVASKGTATVAVVLTRRESHGL